MEDCLFCKIVAGDIPCHQVYEDEHVLAFLDIHPINPGHTLVVPRQHVDEFQDMETTLYTHVFTVVQELAQHIKNTLSPPRVGLVVEGFDVNHVHVHVIPLQDINDFRSKRTAEDMQAEPDHDALENVRKNLARE